MVGRNFEARKMKNIPFTGIRRVLEKALKIEKSGKSVIHFEIGQPDFSTPEHIKQAAKDALDKGLVRYTSNYGLPSLRKEIAKKLKRVNGIDLDPDEEIIVTIGGQEAIAATLLSFLDPGDEVLIGDPGYIPYYSLTHLASAIPVPVPLKEDEGYIFDINAMKKAITNKTKMLILNTPNNPTGAVLDKKHMLEIAEICKEHDLLVLSDEAYEQIIYDDKEHISFATLPNMKKRTITVQTMSKTYSMTGWRLGYLAAPKNLVSIIIRAHQNLVLSSTSFAQAGGILALSGPQDDLLRMVSEFDKRREFLYEGLKRLGIPCYKPQGAFYLFPNISEFGLSSWSFSELLLEKYNVATVPGIEFGKTGEGHIRISYATSYENCIEGLERIEQAVENLRGK
jgi:aspartate/methionine/tyrosine aminotransferase